MKKIKPTPAAAALLMLLGGCADGFGNRQVSTIDHEWFRVAGAMTLVDGEMVVAMHERVDGARIVFGCSGQFPVLGAFVPGMTLGREGETRVVDIIVDGERTQQTWMDVANVSMTWGTDAATIMEKLGMADQVVITTNGHSKIFDPNFAGAVRAMAKECPDAWNRT